MAIAMIHEKDPRDVILNKAGNLNDLHIYGNLVLVGVYLRGQSAQKTAGGIYLTDSVKDEDKYQGKVGLILKAGPMAFKEADRDFFGGELPQTGDWVFLKAADGWSVELNPRQSGGGLLCRMLLDGDIRGKIPHPDYVW